MNKMNTWTEADYEKMSWHDNHVYGIHINEGEDLYGNLILELDYILEWLKGNEKEYRFRVAPALLTFIDIWDLKIEIDYAAVTAEISPFSINSINREIIDTIPGKKYYNWSIIINWPKGRIYFKGHGFKQILLGNIIETDNQVLTRDQRNQAREIG